MLYIILILIILVLLSYKYNCEKYKEPFIVKTDINDNDIIFNTIIDLGKKSNTFYGKDKLLSNQYSLVCYDDNEIEDKIISNLIKNKKDKYNLIYRMKKDLNLKENIIYPIKNTGKYTIHGLQYFTAEIVRRVLSI